MLTLHFHALSRTAPYRFVGLEMFDLPPCHAPDLTRPHGREREKTGGQPGHGISRNCSRLAQYGARFIDFNDGPSEARSPAMAYPNTADMRCRTRRMVSIAGRASIPGSNLSTIGAVISATGWFPMVGKTSRARLVRTSDAWRRVQVGAFVHVPIARQCLEGSPAAFVGIEALPLALQGRVPSLPKELLCGAPLIAGLRRRDLRMTTECRQRFLATKLVPLAPKFAAVGFHAHMEANTIG